LKASAQSILNTRLIAALLLCATSPCSAVTIDDAKVVDLTYSFGTDTIYWPASTHFSLQSVAKGPTPQGYWYESNDLCTSEHGGTHMDAPIHFSRGRSTSDQLPVTAGIGPLVRVDVGEAAARDPDYRLDVRDLEAWESRHGRIPRGAIVVMFSGWGERWPDPERYLGTAVRGDTENLHFPGFSASAARFLIEKREIKAIAVDTPSIDYGQSKDFIVHQIVHGADKPAFENIANLDRVPASGATLVALPMKIEGGSGGPLRAIAVLP
jgi:kynurenine formamidase